MSEHASRSLRCALLLACVAIFPSCSDAARLNVSGEDGGGPGTLCEDGAVGPCIPANCQITVQGQSQGLACYDGSAIVVVEPDAGEGGVKSNAADSAVE